MLFPDETNLRHVASALWKDPDGISQASVIVGAGFSKNAVPRASSVKASSSFPSWNELTNVMVDELYAHETEQKRKSRKAGASGAVSSALRIAEEYEAARGRGQLDSLLKRAIPDLDFDPGALHIALCELPWADILTTNYDTLLERAARSQLERRYHSVLSQQDIPTTKQPRIIKLHGSFPESKQPFIITEEDFRTYESDFPAMVNLAQQCLAEKTCCLVGFSGDDPNFLRWSGWVRDVLGHSHMQPVYLVGLHDHSPSQKSLLDRRHVRTIDLSPLFPRSDWPDVTQRHQAATTWFIEALKSLKPAETYEWPANANSSFTDLEPVFNQPELPLNNAIQFKAEFAQPDHIELPDDVDAVETPNNFHDLPIEEQEKWQIESLEHINGRNRGQELDKRIDLIVEVWKGNRALYPGWLVLPWSNHHKLLEMTATWASLIPERALKQKKRETALNWLTELNWRLERALTPWSSQMIDCVDQLVNSDGHSRKAQTNETELDLALQLLRAFREDGRSKDFATLRGKLIELPNIPIYAKDFISQQTTIFHLENWRIKDALNELLLWDPSGSDALWKAKRSALIGEFQPEQALVDALDALKTLQRKPELSDLNTRSREAYVLWLSTVLTNWDAPQRQDFVRRRRAIQRKSFDAFNFEERLSEALRSPPKSTVSRSELLGELKRGETQVTRAYTMRRFIEETAGLIAGPGFTVYASNIKKAVPWMALSDPEEAFRLGSRFRTSSKTDWTFPDHMLAALGRNCISEQVEGIFDTLSFLTEEPKLKLRFRSSNEPVEPNELLTKDNRNSILRAAVSQGARLQTVLTKDQNIRLVTLLLGLRRMGRELEWQSLNEIEGAIHSGLNELSSTQFDQLAPELIQQPLSGYDRFPINPITRRDVIVSASFRNADDPDFREYSKSNDLTEATSNLLRVQKNGETFDLKWIATMRLAFGERFRLLSKQELRAFKKNLDTQLEEIEANTNVALNCDAFHPADLLTISAGNLNARRMTVLDIISNAQWPSFLQRNEKGDVTGVRHLAPYKEPSSLAVELTLEPWVNSSFHLKPNDWAEGHVSRYLKTAKVWLEEEGKMLVEREEQTDPQDIFSAKGELTWRLERISKFCNNIALLGHFENKELISAAASLSKNIYELVPRFGVKYCPILIYSAQVNATDMAKHIRQLYAGNDPSDKFTALMAVLVWATSSKHVDIETPPTDLVTEFAVMIRTRREPDLGWALDIARILLKRCPELIEPAFYEDALLGLSYLSEETDPSSPTSSVLNQNVSLSDLRVSALKLLKELPESSFRKEVIQKWQHQSNDEVDQKVLTASNDLNASE